MRTFIALRIPMEVKLKQALSEFMDALRFEKMKWVNFDTLHLTLSFLGSTSQREIDVITMILNDHLANFPIFTISLKGFGIFEVKGSPKVVWVRVEKSIELLYLQRRVAEMLVPLGFKVDVRGFNPHITISRIKHLDEVGLLEEFIREKENVLFQQNLVDEVILYKSELLSQERRYTPISIQRLGKY